MSGVGCLSLAVPILILGRHYDVLYSVVDTAALEKQKMEAPAAESANTDARRTYLTRVSVFVRHGPC